MVGGVFDPSKLSGLVMWVKTDAGLFQESTFATPAVADADPVGGWRDQSGQGNDLTQATAGSRPTLKVNIQNGRPVLRFLAATLQYMDTTAFTLSQPTTAIFAGNITNTNGKLTDAITVINRRMFQCASAGATLRVHAGASVDLACNPGTFSYKAAIWNGTSSLNQQDDGTQTGDCGANNSTGIRIGAGGGTISSYMTGDIGEIIFYNRALTTAELNQLRGYIRQRWATA